MIPRYRVWHKEEKKMYYADLKDLCMFIGCVTDSSDYRKYKGFFDWTDGKDIIFMQSFFGLEDKNRKEMFEKDIVDYEYEDGTGEWQKVRGVLEWEMKFQVALVVNTKGIKRRIVEADLVNIEIVGNSCENSELIKEE